MSDRAPSYPDTGPQNNIPRDMYTSRESLPNRLVAFGRTFQRHERQGAMKICYSDTEGEKFLQIPEPETSSRYYDRVVQGVTARHNQEKLKENGIKPITEYHLKPMLINDEAYLAMYGDFVSDSDTYFNIPPSLEDDYRKDLKATGQKVFDLMLEGELAYLENAWSWTENITNNRAVKSSGEVMVTDMGELGKQMFGEYRDSVIHEGGHYNFEDFVFDSFDQAPYETEEEFLETHNLYDDIESLLDPRLSEIEIAQTVETKQVYPQ